jgi:hypothetical protein
MAILIAAVMEDGSTSSGLAAISKAVPCKGEVLTNGSPRVIFTPV